MITTITGVVVQCGKCGIVFEVPANFDAERRKTGDGFYCPNGHSRAYIESEVQKLQKRLDAEITRSSTLAAEATRERERREVSERKLARVAKGVCPWCKRSFTNLRRHVACKHKEKA